MWGADPEEESEKNPESDGKNCPKKMELVQKMVEVDREKVAWVKKSMEAFSTHLAENNLKTYDNLGDMEDLTLYLGTSERNVAFILTGKEAGCEDTLLLDARSQYLPEFDLDSSSVVKAACALKWALDEHESVLRSKELFKVMTEYSGEELLAVLADHPNHEIVILPSSASNPAAALCLRDLCTEPHVSHLKSCRTTLTILISALCSKARIARQAIRRQRLHEYRAKKEEKRRMIREGILAKQENGRTILLNEYEWDRDCGDLIADAGLRPLLSDFRHALRTSKGLSAKDANSGARKAAEALAERGIHYDLLKDAYLSGRKSRTDEDSMKKVQELIRKHKVQVPEPMNAEQLDLSVYKHLNVAVIVPEEEDVIDVERPPRRPTSKTSSSIPDGKAKNGKKAASDDESLVLSEEEHGTAVGPAEASVRMDTTLSELSDIDEDDIEEVSSVPAWFLALVESGSIEMEQSPVARKIWGQNDEITDEDAKERKYDSSENKDPLMKMLCTPEKMADFKDLLVFYEQTLSQCYKKNADEAQSLARKCVECWQIIGVSYEGFRDVCVPAVQVQKCLPEFLNKFSSTFGSIFCFSDPDVDIRAMMLMTLLFFAAWELVLRSASRGDKPARTFASVKKGAVAAAKSKEGTPEMEEKLQVSFTNIITKINQCWSPATLGLLFTSFQKSVKGATDKEVIIAFQAALLAKLEFEVEERRMIFSEGLLKEIILFSKKVKVKDEEGPEEDEDEDVEDGEVLSDDDGGEDDDDIMVVDDDEELGFFGELISFGDREYQSRCFAIRTKNFEVPSEFPECSDQNFKPLFESYYKDVYRRGMAFQAQANWKVVAKSVAEELVRCWKLTGFNTLNDILNRVEKAKNERCLTNRNGALTGVFNYLLGSLQDKKDLLPPLVQLVYLAKDTVICCDDIIMKRRREFQLELKQMSRDSEMTKREAFLPKGDPISDEEMEEDAPGESVKVENEGDNNRTEAVSDDEMEIDGRTGGGKRTRPLRKTWRTWTWRRSRGSRRN